MLAGHIAWADKMNWEPTPTGDSWFIAYLCAVLPALIWPLLALWLLLHRCVPQFRWAVGAEREGRVRAARKQAEKDARRIADLERELGIR
jgi:hypothetical protein